MIAVCITTYNQESFIAQAIESVLKQQCDEPIRIYIGDDASTDGTAAICQKYAQQDQCIVYVRRLQNIGLLENTIDVYRRIIDDGCEFIAMLDGDDYWTDAHKLQIQVDYLRLHPEVGLVHTAAYEDVDGALKENDNPNKPTGDIHLLYNREGAQHTNCTVLFRSSLLQVPELEAISEQRFLMIDYPLYGLFSQRTHFGYIHQYTAAWRKHTSTSQPVAIYPFLRYQYHYARAWKWLDKRNSGAFHFSWFKALKWYVWQVVYSVIHYSKVYITHKFGKKMQ